jgi:hypothetical protein
MNKFETAQSKIAEVISHSKTEEDPTHSRNALEWLLVLRPDANEVVRLAVLAHDIERALPDRLTQGQFSTYKEFKSAHAQRAGEVAAEILKDSGYSGEDAARVFEIIKDAEFGNDDPDVNLVMDADSMSFFDNNISLYLARKGLPATQEKVLFMYNRASDRAKAFIQEVMAKKPELGIKLS